MKVDSSLTKTMQPTTTGAPMSIGDSISSESLNSYRRKNQIRLKLSRCLTIAVVLTTLLVIGAVVVVYGVKLSHQVVELERKIEKLEQKLINSNTSLNAVAESNAMLEDQLQHLRHDITELQDSTNATGSLVREKLLENELLTNQSISDIREHLERINQSLAHITSASTRQPLAGCFYEKSTCTIGIGNDLPISNTFYQGCRTPLVPRAIEGHHTMSIHCELQASYIGLLEPSQIEVLGQEVQCWCGFAYIGADEAAAHAALPDDLWAVCAMVITRCPV